MNNLIFEYRCFQISFKKKNLPYLSEFIRIFSKDRTFNFNRAREREDVLRERSEERDGYMVKRIAL